MSQPLKIYAAKAPWPFLKGYIRDIRPTWFMEEVGEPYERIVLDPMKGETRSDDYKGVNPFGKIPSIDDNGFVLLQSNNICLYLADKFGKLAPKAGTKERALHDQWVYFAVNDIEPASFGVLNAQFFLKKEDPREWLEQSSVERLNRLLPAPNEHLGKHRYMTGNEFTVADLALSCTLRPVKDHACLEPCPNIRNYLARIYDRPAFKKAFELNGT